MMRQLAQAGVMQDAMQNPMDQIAQMMQMQGQQQQMMQQQEESPLMMALKQIQMEAGLAGLRQDQQQFDQNAQMNPLQVQGAELNNQRAGADIAFDQQYRPAQLQGALLNNQNQQIQLDEAPQVKVLRQLQIEAAQRAGQQSDQMFPLNMAREQIMADYYKQRAVDPYAAMMQDPSQQMMPNVDPGTAQFIHSQNQ